MPAQALYRKWRPQLWDEVVGQEHVVQTLRNALRTDHVAHAYLFAGPRGCGKTTSARLVAKAVNCTHPDLAQRPDNTCPHCVAVTEGRFLDLVEIDGASNNSVDDVRELREKINFSPSEGRYRVYIVDEVHMLSTPAFNALLKTLEEPPPHAIFILATTESHKIPATVASRCQRFEFRRIPVNEIVARLRTLCEQEQLEAEEAALELVARQATGSMRDAISLLDQLAGAGTAVTLGQAQALLGTSAGAQVQGLVEALATGDLAAGLGGVNAAVDAGADPRQLARQVVDYLRNLLLVRLGNAALVEATAEARTAMARHAQHLDGPALLRAIRAFNSAANEARGGWQPQLPLELAVVECLTRPGAAEPEPASRAEAARPEPARGEAAPARATPPARARPASPAPVPGARPEAARAEPEPASPGERRAPAATAPLAERPERRAAEPAGPADGNAAATPAEAPQSMADLRAAWARALKVLKEQDKMAEALLRSCTVLGLEGQVLRLSTSEFVYQKITGDEATAEHIEAALELVFGFACRVRCEPAGKASKRRGDDIPQDGMVATALDLGGEIVD